MQGVVLDSNSTIVLKATFSVDRYIRDSAYFFPLTGIALFGIRITVVSPGIPERIIIGKVAVSEESINTRPSLFTTPEEVYKISLGAVAASSTVFVQVAFAQSLCVEGSSLDALRLVLPSTLLYRHLPAGGASDTAITTSGGDDTAVSEAAVPSWRVSLTVHAAKAIDDVSSPTHGTFAHTEVSAVGSTGAATIVICVPKSQVRQPCVHGPQQACLHTPWPISLPLAPLF